MRNIVILNRFPLEAITYYKWVDTECNIYLFSKEQPYPGIFNYKEVHFYSDYDKSEKVILDIIELSKKVKIDEIVGLSEKDVLRAGKLRSFLGINGLDANQSWQFRDKVAMKDALSIAEIPVADYKAVYDVTDILSFAEKNDHKIVIKPRRDAGSRGVTVISTKSELENYLLDVAHYLSPNNGSNLMVESFIEGELYHVDGIYHENQLISSFVSKYITSCLDFKDSKPLMSLLVDETDRFKEQIREVTEHCLNTLSKNSTCLFHAEVFVDKEGQIFLNEIACRIGGAKIYSTIKNIGEYDLISEYLGILSGLKYRKSTNKPKVIGGWVLVPPKKGVIKKLAKMPHYDWLLEHEINAVINQELGNAASSVDKLFNAIIKGENTEQVKNRLDYITEYFYNNTEISEVN